MTSQILSQERLRYLLDYDPIEGLFRWIRPTSNRIRAGSVCGCRDKHGYVVIRVDRKLYKAHQLAWLYTHGSFALELDHINQIRDDNRIHNLRVASRSMQMHNAGMLRNNTSGAKGVSYHAAAKKWHARIWVSGKCHSVGYFSTIEEAQKERNAVHNLLSGR